MRAIEKADRIIVGVDPGMAPGKPYAVVSVAYWGNEGAVIDFCSRKPIRRNEPLMITLSYWLNTIWNMWVKARGYGVPDIRIATEDARGVGGRGYKLQALVRSIQDMEDTSGERYWSEEESFPFVGCTVMEPINPNTIKSHVGGSARATAEDVARVVEMSLLNTEILPMEKDYDFHAAAAVCEVANHQILMEELEAMAA